MSADAGAPSRRAPQRRLTLLVRAYCHLCDEMRAALSPLIARRGIELVELDVDDDPLLAERYGELVPVLLAGDAESGRELCHYVLDPQRVRDAL